MHHRQAAKEDFKSHMGKLFLFSIFPINLIYKAISPNKIWPEKRFSNPLRIVALIFSPIIALSAAATFTLGITGAAARSIAFCCQYPLAAIRDVFARKKRWKPSSTSILYVTYRATAGLARATRTPIVTAGHRTVITRTTTNFTSSSTVTVVAWPAAQAATLSVAEKHRNLYTHATMSLFGPSISGANIAQLQRAGFPAIRLGVPPAVLARRM